VQPAEQARKANRRTSSNLGRSLRAEARSRKMAKPMPNSRLKMTKNRCWTNKPRAAGRSRIPSVW